MNEPKQFSAIFGTGRSGTTWLGSLIDAHPRVAYRFEPIHALSNNKRMQHIRKRIKIAKGQELEQALKDLKTLLIRANPRIERPPFYPKSNRRLHGRTLLNRACRALPQLSIAYGLLYPESKEAHLVLKEVSMEHELGVLASSEMVSIIYLIRHPAAFVASMESGIHKGVMNDTRARIALDLAEERAPELHREFIDQADLLTLQQRLAISWVADTNLAMKGIEERDTVLPIVYEDLCQNISARASDIYNHLGLDMPTQARDIISKFEGTPNSQELGVNPYFSVFRNPIESMNKWKSRLSADTINDIRNIAERSVAYNIFKDYWDWKL